MQITGTFLDEISHDIPHQNWGRAEWDQDFASMKSIALIQIWMLKLMMTYKSINTSS